MPIRRGGTELQDRFEDGDVAEVPDDLVPEYQASHNFVEAPPNATGTPYIVDDGEPVAVKPEARPRTRSRATEPSEPVAEPEA